MARVVPGGNCTQLDLPNGQRVNRQRDGSFHVDNERTAKQLAEAVGGFVAGTFFGSENPEPAGPWCRHGRRPFYCESCKDTQ
jgi:hypothetical protein